MFERIHIKNYKCLRDVTVDLGDFTILIGPNDSGKSSFLEVIQTFGKIAQPNFTGIFQGDRSLDNLVWRKDAGRNIVWEVTGSIAEHRFVYYLELSVDRRPPPESLEWDGKKLFWTQEAPAQNQRPAIQYAGPPGLVVVTANGQAHPAQPGAPYLSQFIQQQQAPFTAIADALKSSIEYRFELGKLPTPAIPKPGITLESSGANLAAVLDVLQNSPDRSAFELLQKALCDAIPNLRGIVLPPAQHGGAKALEFILSGNGQIPVTIPGSLASGGALLLTAFLTLAYTQTPGLLLFEEPENGLHPTRLQMVVEILRKMSRGEVGNRKRQSVVTTHNPLLLNYADPEEVRVFVRHPERGTCVIPMKEAPDIDKLLKEFALGELWYLLGEEKLFQEQTV